MIGGEYVDNMNGFNSLMNENSSPYKRGDIVHYWDRFGNQQKGKYVMASSADGYIVINAGGQHGRAVVVNLKSCLPLGKEAA